MLEREFDAYKLSRCMCPSIYNRFWDRANICEKIILSYPPCIRRPRLGGSRRNVGTPFGMEKLEWCRYPTVEKFRRCLFVLTWSTNVTDGRTDRLHDSIDRACIASRGKNVVCKRKKFVFNTFLNFKPVKRTSRGVMWQVFGVLKTVLAREFWISINK